MKTIRGYIPCLEAARGQLMTSPAFSRVITSLRKLYERNLYLFRPCFYEWKRTRSGIWCRQCITYVVDGRQPRYIHVVGPWYYA